MSFGSRLKEARKSKKLTQIEVASTLGIDDTTISKYENDKSEPDNETLKKLSALYDVSIDYLVGRTADPKRVLKEQARQLIDMVDRNLNDEEVVANLNLILDGQLVEKEEVLIFISLIRQSRAMMKRGLASQENKR